MYEDNPDLAAMRANELVRDHAELFTRAPRDKFGRVTGGGARLPSYANASASAEPEPAALSAQDDDDGELPEVLRLTMLSDHQEFMAGRDSAVFATPGQAELLELATVTAGQRGSGVAMPGGHFPIPDKHHLSLAVGRYHAGHHAGQDARAIAAHIRKRARELGEPDPLGPGHGGGRGATRHRSGVHHSSIDGSFGTGSGIDTGGPSGAGGAAMSGYLRIADGQALALTAAGELAADALLDAAHGIAANRAELALAHAEAERDRAELASAFAPTSAGGTGRQGTGMNPAGAVREQYTIPHKVYDVGSAGDGEDETDPEKYIAALRARHKKVSGRASTDLDELFGQEDYPVRGGTGSGRPQT